MLRFVGATDVCLGEHPRAEGGQGFEVWRVEYGRLLTAAGGAREEGRVAREVGADNGGVRFNAGPQYYVSDGSFEVSIVVGEGGHQGDGIDKAGDGRDDAAGQSES